MNIKYRFQLDNFDQNVQVVFAKTKGRFKMSVYINSSNSYYLFLFILLRHFVSLQLWFNEKAPSAFWEKEKQARHFFNATKTRRQSPPFYGEMNDRCRILLYQMENILYGWWIAIQAVRTKLRVQNGLEFVCTLRIQFQHKWKWTSQKYRLIRGSSFWTWT